MAHVILVVPATDRDAVYITRMIREANDAGRRVSLTFSDPVDNADAVQPTQKRYEMANEEQLRVLAKIATLPREVIGHLTSDFAEVVKQAAHEANSRFNHNYIGTEHLLLGCAVVTDTIAYKVSAYLGIEPGKVRSAIDFIIGKGDRTIMGDVDLTPRAKKALELAIEEARRLGHHYVGAEHILLGLVREGEGIHAGILESLGVDLGRIQANVMHFLAAD
jgi:hypothetical protein